MIGQDLSYKDQAYVIFSVPNRYLGEMDVLMSKGTLKVKHLIGSYKGKIENSYIVPWNQYNTMVAGWVALKDEECVLFLSGETNACGEQKAYLVGKGWKEHAGWFRSVDYETAMKEDSWTWDYTNKEWFIIGPSYLERIIYD